jgi:hypothetical protein
MTQDNIQTDTPQEAQDNPQYNSLEEAVFGNDMSEGSKDISGAFTNSGDKDAGNVASGIMPGEPTPVEGGFTESNTDTQGSNDEKRYQYWQSQADKYKNELDGLKSNQGQVQQQPVENVQSEEKIEEFPSPPIKPQKPRVFNREESYSDPTSESARYLDEVEEWRDNMNEYNSLKSQYQTAVIEEKFSNMEQKRIDAAKRYEANQEKSRQVNEIKHHVMGHYGMNENSANDFMEKMSDPKSLTIDNLVKLYRMQSGGNSSNASATPSSDFQQIQNAQQVPSPMGVMPSGQSNVDGRSMEDKIMDNLIGNFNDKNPWK